MKKKQAIEKIEGKSGQYYLIPEYGPFKGPYYLEFPGCKNKIEYYKSEIIGSRKMLFVENPGPLGKPSDFIPYMPIMGNDPL